MVGLQAVRAIAVSCSRTYCVNGDVMAETLRLGSIERLLATGFASVTQFVDPYLGTSVAGCSRPVFCFRLTYFGWSGVADHGNFRVRGGNRNRRGDSMTLGRWPAFLAVIFTVLIGATAAPKRALAEFEIQETQVEKGEVEIDYRGAVHFGFPRAEREAAEGDEGGAALEEEEEGEFLRQSHDLEPQFGITERWLFSITLSADEPLDNDFDVSEVEIENQYEVIERQGDGFGLAFMASYGFATRGGKADEIGFAPFVELDSGPRLFTANPIFTSQIGDNRDTDGLGFEYGWRAEYTITDHWSAGVEMFGEIEDLSHAG